MITNKHIKFYFLQKKIEICLKIADVSTFAIPIWQNLENHYM